MFKMINNSKSFKNLIDLNKLVKLIINMKI